MKLDNRFEVIQPKMTLRQAQVAAGKRPADAKHPSRWDFDERVEFLITQLQDAEMNKAVRQHAEERKHARSARAAARAVEEERSAEYREALRELREKTMRSTRSAPSTTRSSGCVMLVSTFARSGRPAPTSTHSFLNIGSRRSWSRSVTSRSAPSRGSSRLG
jgi:hypothetical protein